MKELERGAGDEAGRDVPMATRHPSIAATRSDDLTPQEGASPVPLKGSPEVRAMLSGIKELWDRPCSLPDAAFDAIAREWTASLGAAGVWHSREVPTPKGRLLWTSDGVDVWMTKGDGKVFSERATACKWWTLAIFPALPNGEPPKSVQDLLSP